ncbi:MAG: DUF5106 domain-containing protein, partial [Bacteroidetes bacterium]
MNQKFLSAFFLFFSFSFFLAAQQQSGFHIEVQIDNWTGEQLYLGYRRGEKVYSRDTVPFAEGKAVFEGSEPLAPGIYLVLMPPDNKFFEFLVTTNEQHFSMKTAAPDFGGNLTFENAPENTLLKDYQLFMAKQVARSKELQQSIEAAPSPESKAMFQKQLEAVSEEVHARQRELMEQHPGTFAAKLVAAFKEPEFPPTPPGQEEPLFRWQYYKKHYFDGFDFTEEAFANSPYLKEKIDYYLSDKMTVQVPDSVIQAVDVVLEKAQANEEVFKFVLPYLLNEYYTPKIMGLDAVFVHIAEKYYATGKATWISEDAKKKILDDAYMNKFVLIGNRAPNITVQQYDPETKSFPPDKLISLYDVDAEYTVIFLWKPGCGHCKHTTDELKPFYEEWHPKGVEIFSITSANHMELDKAISDVEYKKMPWIVTADPYMKARALIKFYGTTLPKLYILDRNKNIIASRVAVPQLGRIIEDHQRMSKEENR